MAQYEFGIGRDLSRRRRPDEALAARLAAEIGSGRSRGVNEDVDGLVSQMTLMSWFLVLTEIVRGGLNDCGGCCIRASVCEQAA